MIYTDLHLKKKEGKVTTLKPEFDKAKPLVRRGRKATGSKKRWPDWSAAARAAIIPGRYSYPYSEELDCLRPLLHHHINPYSRFKIDLQDSRTKTLN
jgi:hypothetical protein